MYLKNIYIRDFGIFNNQKLKKLSDQIIVLGGKNRAGKSTFLDIIRYLGYGLPQDGSIPPALNQYYIEAELENAEENYNLTLNGYAKPEILDSSGQAVSAAELYNNLDQLSYQHLFTISLDELQQLSKVVKGKKSRKRLYSILLGAGLSELIRVPEIADQYFKNAKNIGGTRGDPSVSSFKAYYQEIKTAEERRDAALKEIDEFNQQQDKLEVKKEDLKELKRKLSRYQREEFLLDLLKNNYDTVQKIEDLEIELKQQNFENKNLNQNQLEKIKSYRDQYLQQKEELEAAAKAAAELSEKDELSPFIELILAEKTVIKSFMAKKELLRERIKNLKENEEKLQQNFNILKSELQELNLKWDNPLEQLKEIDIDFIKQQELIKAVDKYQKLKTETEKLKSQKEEIKLRISAAAEKISNFNFTEAEVISRRTYTTSAAAAVIGAVSLYLELYPFFYFSAVIFLTAIIYYSSNYKSAQMKAEALKENKLEKKELDQKLKFLQTELKQKQNDSAAVELKLQNYAQKLGIENDNYISLLSDYYRQVQDKKSRFRLLQSEKEENEGKKNELKTELKNLAELIKKTDSASAADFYSEREEQISLFNISEQLFKDLIQIEDILKNIENYCRIEADYKRLKTEIKEFLQDYKKDENLEKRINSYLREAEKAEKYQQLKREFQKEKAQLEYTLNSSDKIKDYLSVQDQKNNQNSYQAFISIYRNYSSLKAVEKKHEHLSSELNKLRKQKKEIENQITTLKNRIEELAASEEIEIAQVEINQARNNLRRLAEDYAVNKSVYFILNKLRSRMISRAETELLKPAADILARITENEYQAIETAADLEAAEFRTINAEGKKIDSVEHLSRGTLEQLFLAVRLSRIREIKPPLPVVLDDSLVNFDRSHLYHTAEIISELAAEHQIFILSCHPHLIGYIKELSHQAQYWKLEKGEFKASSADLLIDHLSN